MNRFSGLKTVLIGTLFLSITHFSHAQILEAEFSFGYTAVNISSWTGMHEGGSTFDLYDWSNSGGFAALHGLFPVSDNFYIGGSFAFQHLIWYEYRYLYDQVNGSYTYIEESVNSVRLHASGRYLLGKNFVEVGLGPHWVQDFINVSVIGSFGHSFTLLENLSIPAKVSINVIPHEWGTMVPITIGTGLTYKLK